MRGLVSITYAPTRALTPRAGEGKATGDALIGDHHRSRGLLSSNYRGGPSVGGVHMPRVSPAAYHRVTRVALWSLVAIVITGSAVRLTGSGLGCSDWPNCEPGSLIPANEFHGWVEFGNRLVTGLVSLAVIAAVSAAPLRVPTDRRLVWWAGGLAGGVAGQVALGAVTVLTHLSPPIVMAHFLLSIVLVWNAVVLHHLAEPGKRTPSTTPSSTLLHTRAVALVGLVVIVTGTVVTGAGPHGGDEDVERLGIAVTSAARIHGISVVSLVALTLWLARRARPCPSLRRRVEIALVIMAVQATIGYVQYFTEVPTLLVALHIAGATALWISLVRMLLTARNAGTDICAERLAPPAGHFAQ